MTSEPTTDQLGEYADWIDVPLEDARAETLTEAFVIRDETVSKLDDLGRRYERPDRRFWDPDPEEDPHGAFLTRCDVRTAGDGPLSGVTVAAKDNIAVAGVPMTCGSPLLEGFVPPTDATVVERLLDAGVRIIGKANMDEFANGNGRNTQRFRVARNPHDPDYQPGGSSGGSGIAVADGLVDVALGSETGGSVRIPAAWCGVVGLKPSRGLVSHHGFVQFAKSVDTIGVLAQRVEDAAAALEAIAGEDPRDPLTTGITADDYSAAVRRRLDTDPTDLTIGVIPSFVEQVDDPGIDRVIAEALEELDDAGATVREVTIDALAYAMPAFLAVAMTEIGAYFQARAVNYWNLTDPIPELPEVLHEQLRKRGEELGGPIVESWLYAHHLNRTSGGRYYALGHRGRRAVAAGVDEALGEVDVLAAPTVPIMPPEVGEVIKDTTKYTAPTRPFSLTGHPAITVNAGTVDGLPVGLQFIGERYDEAGILRAAAHHQRIKA